MRRLSLLWRAPALAWALLAFAVASSPAADLYQVGTIEALGAGDYAGRTTFAVLARHGDFGLGTFADLDGEMVALDGRFYRAGSDGSVREVPPAWTAPFAQVVHFTGSLDLGRVDGLDLAALTATLASRLPDPSRFYAVRVDGLFETLSVRSVPAQPKPWPTLAEAIQGQAVFPLAGVQGTLVGYYTPAGAPALSPPGWHFHFLSADRRQGGHVLAARLGPAKARGDGVTAMTVVFSEHPLPRRDAAKPAPGQE
uniref:Alpha-acetolactate decarboxylase n=1 Tax=Desulfovibrio sp. U5L TaxID=596152 RepID=I2PZH7_9BACT